MASKNVASGKKKKSIVEPEVNNSLNWWITTLPIIHIKNFLHNFQFVQFKIFNSSYNLKNLKIAKRKLGTPRTDYWFLLEIVLLNFEKNVQFCFLTGIDNWLVYSTSLSKPFAIGAWMKHIRRGNFWLVLKQFVFEAYYLQVHWDGYDSSDDSWEPEAGLNMASEALEAFLTSNDLPRKFKKAKTRVSFF